MPAGGEVWFFSPIQNTMPSVEFEAAGLTSS